MAGGNAHPGVYLYRIDEPIAERMALEAAPRERVVHSYSLTRAAQRTLSLITSRLDSGSGDCFWLADPPGAGKTHFLNYFFALRRQLAAANDSGRELVLSLDCSQSGSAQRLENDLLAAMAKELGGGERRGAPLWRRLGADAGIEIALAEARRTGVRAVTIAIDFGSNDIPEFAANLVQIARGSRNPTLTIIAAGKGDSPPDAVSAEIGPADFAEQLVIAIRRVRQLQPRWASMARLYQGVAIEPFAAAEIFPFHPQTLHAIAALIAPVTVAGLARLARDVLSVHKDQGSLLYPCELLEAPQARGIIDERLGANGREAMRLAEEAVQSVPRHTRQLAAQIVRTLALAYLCARPPALEMDELARRLPPHEDRTIAAEALRELLRDLASHASGAIATSPVGAAFVPAQRASADIERFNDALTLLRLFDSALEPVRDEPELSAAIAQLDHSLSNLAEDVNEVADTLEGFARACGTQIEADVRSIVEALVQLVGGGARRLVEAVTQHDQAKIRSTLGAYRELAAAAAFVPSLFAMKEYLERSRLDPENVDFRQLPEIGNLAAERRLLEAELGPQAPYSKARDSLQARFEKFKWSYIEQYRDAHQRWRAQMETASGLALDLGRSLDALLRLDTISALGPPSGAQFITAVKQAGERIKVCGLDGPFNAHAVPICPECGYILGTVAPRPDLARLMDKIRRALNAKLTMLSRGAIARLIKKYDHAHRLDGFLKITQAAQTEALIGVLDDQLTSYIARLLRRPDDPEAVRPRK
jgi:hypothetical protein